MRWLLRGILQGMLFVKMGSSASIKSAIRATYLATPNTASPAISEAPATTPPDTFTTLLCKPTRSANHHINLMSRNTPMYERILIADLTSIPILN